MSAGILKNNSDIFDSYRNKIEENSWSQKFNNGKINAEGIKFLGTSDCRDIRKIKGPNPNKEYYIKESTFWELSKMLGPTGPSAPSNTENRTKVEGVKGSECK
jgi:hypothetical protein